ncbi:MAG: tetratricopeptide repeat protein [Candidatus Firestonebacteria bacterium]
MIEIDEYRKKLAENPSSLIFLPLAEIYRKNGMLDEAVSTCRRGLEFHPDYISARIFIAKVWMEKKMFSEAREELEKIIKIDAMNLMAHTMLETIYRSQGEDKKATETQGAINSIAENKLPEHIVEGESNAETVTMAEIFIKQGLLDDAMKVYEKIARRSSADATVSTRLQELRKMKDEQLKSFQSKREKLSFEFKAMQEILKKMQEKLAELEKEL